MFDFYIKKVIFLGLRFLFYTASIAFSEKYIVEYLFTQTLKWHNAVAYYTDYFANETTYSVLGVVILILLLAVILL